MPDDQHNGVPASNLLGARWRKSTFSNSQGDCVELARLPEGMIAVRNSRHPTGPALICTRAQIAAFIQGTRNGDFDDLAS
jgi:Domain of unknown function (DUF397)